MKSIFLLPNKEKSLARRHPWLFSGAIAKKDKDIKEGDIVEIYSSSREYLATGYYQDESIAVKILSFEKQAINQDFFNHRIKSAIIYRKTMGLFDDENNTIFRLINAEGDFLPGLIADFYSNKIIIQFHSAGMYLMREMIVNALVKNLPDTEFIYSKSSSTLPKNESISAKDEFLWINTDHNKRNFLSDGFLNDMTYFFAKENGCSFAIDFKEGQKTGFFIDK